MEICHSDVELSGYYNKEVATLHSDHYIIQV